MAARLAYELGPRSLILSADRDMFRYSDFIVEAEARVMAEFAFILAASPLPSPPDRRGGGGGRGGGGDRARGGGVVVSLALTPSPTQCPKPGVSQRQGPHTHIHILRYLGRAGFLCPLCHLRPIPQPPSHPFLCYISFSKDLLALCWRGAVLAQTLTSGQSASLITFPVSYEYNNNKNAKKG